MNKNVRCFYGKIAFKISLPPYFWHLFELTRHLFTSYFKFVPVVCERWCLWDAFWATLSSVHKHLSCAKSSFEIELDHTGQGLKSTQKGQGAAYLLCRPYEIWPFSVLAWTRSLYLCSAALSFIVDFYKIQDPRLHQLIRSKCCTVLKMDSCF